MKSLIVLRVLAQQKYNSAYSGNNSFSLVLTLINLSGQMYFLSPILEIMP